MEKADALAAAVHALDIAVFEQSPEGTFISVAPVPAWMTAFSRNPTFPFLGSFLASARDFWAEPRTGRLTWGPCAEVDEAGRQFHFTVSALSLPDHRFLVFELDHDAEQTRAALQKAREVILENEQAAAATSRAAPDTTDAGPTRRPQ